MLTERTSASPKGLWGWGSVGVALLLALAVLVSGIGPRTSRSVADEPKKETPGVPVPERAADLEQLFKRLGKDLDDEDLKAFKQQWEEIQKQMEEIRKNLPARGVFPGLMPLPGGFPGDPFGGLNRGEQGRLGVQVEKPSATLVDQLDLPKEQGLVVQRVTANSAAAKAGMKEHDILLEVAGKAVPSDPAGLVKMLDGIKANEPFDAVVLRKGKKETLKAVTLPEAKAKKPAATNPFGGLGGLGGGRNVSTFVIRDGDQFTVKHQENGVAMTLNGSVEDGKGKFASVEIKAGETSKKYDSLEKIPEEHREQVKKLLEMAAKGKVEIRN